MFQIEDLYSLKGQTAIVTGGYTGLGFAISKCFVGAGAKVVVLGRADKEKGQSLLKELGEMAVYYRFDVTDTSNTQEMIDRIIKEQGSVSILVNNAGNHCKKPIEEMTVEDFTGVLDVHLVGAFALTKALVPHMKEQRKGSILFQASMTSYIGQPYVTAYSTAKAGYLGLVHTLSSELSEFGIRVNGIVPGWIDTPMFRKATENDAPRLNKILGRIPMKKVGDPMDVGMAATFLCSRGAAYINGVCLPVDGGALIGF